MNRNFIELCSEFAESYGEVESYQFISGPFDGGWCTRNIHGIVMKDEIITTIESVEGVMHLEGNMIMPGIIRIRFNDRYANYECKDTRNRKYVFKGIV